MFCVSCARNSHVDGLSAGFRKAVQLFAVALTSGALAACAQSSAVNNKSELFSTGRHASFEDNGNSSLVTNKRVAFMPKNHTPSVADKHSAETKVTSYGVASYYAEGNTYRERRTVQSARVDGCSPQLAIRDPIARHGRRHWAVRDRSGQ